MCQRCECSVSLHNRKRIKLAVQGCRMGNSFREGLMFNASQRRIREGLLFQAPSFYRDNMQIASWF